MARTKTRSLAELLTLLLVRHSVAAAALPDLWPRPSQIDTSAAEDTLPIRFKNISFTLGADTPDGVLRKAAARYTAIIMASASFHLSRTQAAQKVGRGQTFVVSVEVADPSSPLSPGPGMNESYALEVQAPGPVLSLDPTATPCKLSAQTVWGALRGMETLAQLAHPAAGAADSLEIDGPVTITDTPRFGWRGMMIDTGRNFLTPTTIKMALDAMSYTKLNLLHWHIVDDQSFAIDSVALPNLAGDGAFSPAHTYTLADIRSIVAYARERGIAVLPELDMPGHSTSWQRGYPEIQSKCSNTVSSSGSDTSGGFSVPMDPTANATYNLISSLLGELDPLFPAIFPFWHLGGDEVQYGCWQNSNDGYMDKFMSAHNISAGDYPGLQAYFEQHVIEIVRDLPSKKRTVLWEDNSKGKQHGTAGLPKDAVVELWKEHHGDSSVLDATVKAGWNVFYTTPDWYFDHGKTLTDGSWEFDYAVDPFTNSTLPEATLASAVLGAESCMWSPHFDSANFMVEAFPRAAAVAERLWSTRSTVDVDDARIRLHAWRCRLLRRGLATGPVDGGVPTGATGKAPASPTTTFGGHCKSGPWEPHYAPPFPVEPPQA